MFIVFRFVLILFRGPQQNLRRAVVEERVCLHVHDIETRERYGRWLMNG